LTVEISELTEKQTEDGIKNRNVIKQTSDYSIFSLSCLFIGQTKSGHDSAVLMTSHIIHIVDECNAQEALRTREARQESEPCEEIFFTFTVSLQESRASVEQK
jgi:hypothetical protein